MHSYTPSAQEAVTLASILIAHPALGQGDFAASLAYAHLFQVGELAADGPYPAEDILELALPLLCGRLRNPEADPHAWKVNAAIAVGTALCILSGAEKIRAGAGKGCFTCATR